MFLDEVELVSLTSRKRKRAQVHCLRMMGVEHRVRPDGSIAVLRAHVELLFGAQAPTDRALGHAEPDWS